MSRGGGHLFESSPARLSWVSAAARQTWAPRRDQVATAWHDAECRSVADGLRRAAILRVAGEVLAERTAEWRALNLAVIPLEMRLATGPARDNPDTRLEFDVAIVQRDCETQFIGSWERNDVAEIAALLGTPACCRAAGLRASRHRLRDPVWSMAMATVSHARPARRVIEMNILPETNILLAAIGIRAVPHRPCRFDCERSILFGTKLRQPGSAGTDGSRWGAEILAWPLEWSALHGIAEIRTPVFKLVTDTDYSAHRYCVRSRGSAWPQEGARGLMFPYKSAHSSRPAGAPGFRSRLAASE